MRKTKIVCTLGPATDREGVLREMVLAGMNVARSIFPTAPTLSIKSAWKR